MFEKLDKAPADPIMGLTEAFRQDPSPHKINLSVGVYQDANGRTPVLDTVKKAEQRLIEKQTSKSYLPIDGSPDYAAAVKELVFGAGSAITAEGRAVTAHTPGGTGALRVAADFLRRQFPGSRLWMSDPTWPNHPKVFEAAGLETQTYPYFDASANTLNFDGIRDALASVEQGDAVLLHGCCHNPTGADLTPAQWDEVGVILADRKAIPLVDFAYQGFADGLEADAQGVRALCKRVPNALIASSFSKNFGLYNERVGALTVVGSSADAADKALSHVKQAIRSNYSNPPAHGGCIVTTILGDAELRAEWEKEVTAMRERIMKMRTLFVDTLRDKGAPQDFSFLKEQRGMFSFSGLTKSQVETLRERYSIYIVGSGRINVAGITEANMEPLCTAIADVLRSP